MLSGKVGVVLGLSNQKSLGWAIAKAWHTAGATVALGIQNDRFRSNVEKLTANWSQPPYIFCCDVADEEQTKSAFSHLSDKLGGKCHALAHSIAYATAHGMKSPLLECTLDDFRVAHEISAYSLISVTRAALPLLTAAEGASVLALTYAGSARVVPEYRIMGAAKASLEALVKYAAVELGPSNIRVNAISPGPVDTLSARGISNFTNLRQNAAARAPVPFSQEDVGNLAAALVSDGCAGITGQIITVDGGASVLM